MQSAKIEIDLVSTSKEILVRALAIRINKYLISIPWNKTKITHRLQLKGDCPFE